MNCSPPDSFVYGILEARRLEWVVLPSFRGSSWPRDQTCVSSVSCLGRSILYHWASWEAAGWWLSKQAFWKHGVGHTSSEVSITEERRLCLGLPAAHLGFQELHAAVPGAPGCGHLLAVGGSSPWVGLRRPGVGSGGAGGQDASCCSQEAWLVGCD